MLKNLLSLTILSLILIGNASGRAVNLELQERALASQTVYPPALQSVVEQLETASASKATEGIEVVFVYEAPTICDTAMSGATATITKTEWVTATTTESCTDSTLVQYSSSSLIQNPKATSMVYGSTGVAAGGYISRSSGGSMSTVNAANPLKLIQALGSPSTSTLLKNGTTSSVTYSSQYTGIGTTKENPVFSLSAVSGSDTISIDSWTFTNALQKDSTITASLAEKTESPVLPVESNHASKLLTSPSTNIASSANSRNAQVSSLSASAASTARLSSITSKNEVSETTTQRATSSETGTSSGVPSLSGFSNSLGPSDEPSSKVPPSIGSTTTLSMETLLESILRASSGLTLASLEALSSATHILEPKSFLSYVSSFGWNNSIPSALASFLTSMSTSVSSYTVVKSSQATPESFELSSMSSVYHSSSSELTPNISALSSFHPSSSMATTASSSTSQYEESSLTGASEQKSSEVLSSLSAPTFVSSMASSNSASQGPVSSSSQESVSESFSVTLFSSSMSALSSVVSSSLTSEIVILEPEKSCVNNGDLFSQISNENPTEYYAAMEHPLELPLGVLKDLPFGTNKFYSNLFLGDQDNTVFLSPYEVYWDKTRFQGLAVQYPNPNRVTYGGTGANGAKQYYFNAVYVAGLYVGATTISSGNNYMRVSDQEALSVGVSLAASLDDHTNYIEFPLVEGMGFVTSIYHGLLVPKLYGNGEILEVEKVTYPGSSRTTQYRVTVGLGETWLVLVTVPTVGTTFDFTTESGILVGSGAVDGLIIQLAIAPSDENLESVYYAAAGQYATGATVSGSIACEQVSYEILYQTTGSSIGGAPLVFALPHHFDILTSNVKTQFLGITIPSTTKGVMRGYLTSVLSFSDAVDTNVQWLPYVRGQSTVLKYTKAQIELIRKAAVDEIQGVDIKLTVLSQGSQYFMGKAVDKYAYMMYVLYTIVQDKTLAASVESALKEVFAELKAGLSLPGLFYDTKFKGVTSKQAFTTPLADYGNGYYNDHHFHYGYFVHAAALIGLVDGKNGGSWAAENREFVNMWVRDVANPSKTDTYFPVSRLFDWYLGHSWAKGLFGTQDGKDQESSSEDVHFSYAMKMWGKVIGDESMEARGDLMLSLQTRAFNLYFLYQDNNDIVPQQILANKVSGIFFENKVDYTTWFGNKPEYIHGIQMIPMTAALGLVRSSVFAQQEWDQILGKITAESAWQGILNSNRVLFDAKSSWSYFADPNFNFRTQLDGGQSRAWALAYAAPFKNDADGL